ncbi:MAG: YitT family protein, partial [Lachnospiraceae bacterium]|nr:YitT family protein [Lachnospiraceae bacterium]
IVTDNADEICQAIYSNSHHGATIMNSEGSFKHEKRKMVYSVIARSEVKKVIKLINDIDPAAFVNSLPTTDFRGKFFYRTYD